MRRMIVFALSVALSGCGESPQQKAVRLKEARATVVGAVDKCNAAILAMDAADDVVEISGAASAADDTCGQASLDLLSSNASDACKAFVLASKRTAVANRAFLDYRRPSDAAEAGKASSEAFAASEDCKAHPLDSEA